MENWYSILRNGLRNLSNTSLMTAGAAYGAGIYASSQYGTSYGYTARYNHGNKSWLNTGAGLQNSFIIAVVEIIKKPGYGKDPNFGIVVVPEEDDIIIRYLFVIKNHAYPSVALDTLKIEFDNHYKKTMKIINDERANNRRQRIEIAFAKY